MKVRYRTNRRMGAFPLLLGMALAACGDATGPTDPEDVTFAAELGIDLAQMTRLPSGVYVQLVRTGTDPAVRNGSVIRLNYSLWLPTGTLVGTQNNVQFDLSQGLIPGFLIGVVGMKTGEIRKIVIPSELGYAELGSPPGIPPHSVLVFSVEILQVVSSP